jgi:Tfp pilus assembly protein PilX
MTNLPQRGFTLLIAVIISSVSLALALAMIDISYKQVTLALTAKQSQYAFANADSALECALYWDQKQDAFNFNDPATSGIACATGDVENYAPNGTNGDFRMITYDVPCEGSGVSASVTVLKAADAETYIYANGYNSCSTSDTRRIERGLKAHY